MRSASSPSTCARTDISYRFKSINLRNAKSDVSYTWQDSCPLGVHLNFVCRLHENYAERLTRSYNVCVWTCKPELSKINMPWGRPNAPKNPTIRWQQRYISHAIGVLTGHVDTNGRILSRWKHTIIRKCSQGHVTCMKRHVKPSLRHQHALRSIQYQDTWGGVCI